MNSCNYSYENENKKVVLKLISQNQQIISEFKNSQKTLLGFKTKMYAGLSCNF